MESIVLFLLDQSFDGRDSFAGGVPGQRVWIDRAIAGESGIPPYGEATRNGPQPASDALWIAQAAQRCCGLQGDLLAHVANVTCVDQLVAKRRFDRLLIVKVKLGKTPAISTLGCEDQGSDGWATLRIFGNSDQRDQLQGERHDKDKTPEFEKGSLFF